MVTEMEKNGISYFRKGPKLFLLLCLFILSLVAAYIVLNPNSPRGLFYNHTPDPTFQRIYDESRNKYIIGAKTLCGPHNDSVFLTVLVESAPEKYLERQAIRETWGSWAKNNSDVRFAFILGIGHGNYSQSDITKESIKYRDIIQGNFIDSYFNLTIKSVSILQWMSTYCSRAKYLLKTDDDMFIHVPNLMKVLRTKLFSRSILGFFIHGAKPVQDKNSKWFTPREDFEGTVYPDYVSGTAYVISGDIIQELFQTALLTKFFWLEDIFITGLCAKQIGVKRVHSDAFWIHKRSVDICAYKNAISGHENTREDIRKIWSEFLANKKCS